MNKYTYLSALIACVIGCGAGGGDDESSLNVPSEQVLCGLTIGTSSRADALRALGPAASSSAVAEHSSLDYQYGVEGATSVSDIAALSLDFDEDEIFEDATVLNIPFPQCWKDQQARAQALASDGGS